MYPPPPPKSLHKHQYIRRHLVTVRFSQLTSKVLTLLALIIAYTWVEISTMAYETNSS